MPFYQPLPNLVRVLEGNLETQDPQHEQFTLYDAVPDLPEARVQFQGVTARVEVSEQRNNMAGSRRGCPQEPPVMECPDTHTRALLSSTNIGSTHMSA